MKAFNHIADRFGSHVIAMLAALTIATPSVAAKDKPRLAPQTVTKIRFWNGNKSSARQAYEQEVLEAALNATRAGWGEWKIDADTSNLPSAEDEAGVFRTKGYDIFGTVMGNPKLATEKKIVVPRPIMKGLLGYRILIIREADRAKFAAIRSPRELQALRMGIPETWADAALFRKNGYTVVEKGSFDDVFDRLRKGEFDYVTFGANEVDSVFSERAAAGGGLVIDDAQLVYYPFPVVYYVNAANSRLADRVTRGLDIITADGTLDAIFERHHGALLAKLNLPARHLITLSNPLLPKEMSKLKPVLARK